MQIIIVEKEKTKMTQSQVFHSVTSISKWAGTNNGLQFLFGDDKLPYVKKDDIYHYFGMVEPTRIYQLICTSERDLQEMGSEVR